MFERAIVGLAAACSALDDDAAAADGQSMAAVTEALQVFNRDDLQTDWRAGLAELMSKSIHAMVRGWCCRLLLDARAISAEELYRLARLVLCPVNPPAQCASWATGLLRGTAIGPLHQDSLWQVFDRWLAELSGPDVHRARAAICGKRLPILPDPSAGRWGRRSSTCARA